MRHTAFLVLGDETNNTCTEIKKYVMMYGESNSNDYFQIMNWSCTNDNAHSIATVLKDETSTNTFCSSLDDEFNFQLQNAVELRTEEEVEHFFSVLYDKTVTIKNQGDSSSLHLFLLIPLYKKEFWSDAKFIMDSLDKIKQSYIVDIIGFSDDMTYLFLNKDSLQQLPSKHKEYSETTIRVCKDVIHYTGKCKHRFIMVQNRNSMGVALNLDKDSLIGILGEFALLCVENYVSIFPFAEETEKVDVCGIGISELNLDKYYFIHYLLRKAYLKVLKRENVTQKEVDVNKVSQIAQNSLEGHINLVSDFYNNEVEPLIKQGRTDADIIADIAPKLDCKITDLSQKIQEFINRIDLSLPEKQAALAQILGTDDELLKGYQFNKKQLTIDDCDSEAINLFIEENNKLTIDENTIVNPILSTPIDINGNVYLPLEELKHLRSKIRESTNYIRQKSKELKELNENLELNEKSQIRLTKNGFTYGNTTYKLIEVKEKPLQESYVPNVTPKHSVDLRNSFTPVKDQGNLGTCSVFSLVSIYEYILKKTNKESDLSERFVYYNVLNDTGKMEDSGSSLYGVVDSITKYGTCLEEYCKYNVEQFHIKPSLEAYTNAETHKIKQALNVKLERKYLTSALTEGYPVAISLKIFDSFGESRKGFVYRPSDEEIKEGKYGNHAMVICGYSTEEKVYIVRNSWGKEFGDKGYCYIPFSYIEDSELTNSACIITSINEGEEVKGLGQQTTVSFNKTDMEIRYSIIRILVDEEKLDLNENKEKYENLRINYESLVQILCNNSKRNELIESAKYRIDNEIRNAKNEYETFINNIRRSNLNDYIKKGKSTFLTILIILILLAVIWGVCFAEIDGWITNNWSWNIIGGMTLSFIILIFYWFYKKHYYRILRHEMEEQAQQIAYNISKKEQERKLIELRLYLAGMIIDRLNKLQDGLREKYILMKSYVGNLSVWYEEELHEIEKMAPVSKEPFLPILSNEKLDEYFENEGERLTEGLYLYKYLNEYELNEEGIKDYKTKIKRLLIDALYEPLHDFKMLTYLQGEKNYYSYLDYSNLNMSTLLPLLEQNSNYFLQTKITDIEKKNEISKYVLINSGTQNETTIWNREFPSYFQVRPCFDRIVSKYKLIVFQKTNLSFDNIVI